MWFKVRASDVTFAESSRKHFAYDFTVPAPPQDVFDLITRPETLSSWMPDYKAARWTTSPPLGVGSIREVKGGCLYIRFVLKLIMALRNPTQPWDRSG